MYNKPLMLGDCKCCIHKEICKEKYMADEIKKCVLNYENDLFTLKCKYFKCEVFYK